MIIVSYFERAQRKDNYHVRHIEICEGWSPSSTVLQEVEEAK